MQNKIELKPNQMILFIGDSITDAERSLRAYKPFGFGYVHFVANFLLAKYPAYNLNIINRGISGDSVRDLKTRWQRDCLDHKPDILSILIGVNDVWRRFEEGNLSRAVFIDEYEATYRQLLNEVKCLNCHSDRSDAKRRAAEESIKTDSSTPLRCARNDVLNRPEVRQKCNSQIVICEPFMFCDDFTNPIFAELRRYVEVVRKIVADYDAVLVPFQTAIDEQIKSVPPQKWSLDSVHPELWAHSWLARQWLTATGFL
jgi:hypothetical protein